MGTAVKDMTGKRYGRLFVLRQEKIEGSRNAMWLVRCDCGTEKVISGNSMRCGGVVSCGCQRRQNQIEACTKHGHTAGGFSPEYSCWSGIIQRCTNPKSRSYSRYGARGITVCKRWKKFDNFLEDMGERPSPNHTIERIDNNEGYKKSNCRWATRQEQMRNISTNRMVTYNGETKCVGEWAQITGINSSTLHSRIFNKNWPIAKAMTHPVANQKRMLTFRGQTKQLSEWIAELKLPRKAVEHRINRGWSAEKALTTPIRARK